MKVQVEISRYYFSYAKAMRNIVDNLPSDFADWDEVNIIEDILKQIDECYKAGGLKKHSKDIHVHRCTAREKLHTVYKICGRYRNIKEMLLEQKEKKRVLGICINSGCDEMRECAYDEISAHCPVCDNDTIMAIGPLSEIAQIKY